MPHKLVIGAIRDGWVTCVRIRNAQPFVCDRAHSMYEHVLVNLTSACIDLLQLCNGIVKSVFTCDDRLNRMIVFDM
jgi:hypothetical protein